MGSEIVIFHLSRFWPPKEPREKQVRLYEEIKSGRKDFEVRDDKKYWRKKLLGEKRPSKAWFVECYPKGNLPRLEADITKISDKELPDKIVVYFTNVKETEH